MRAMGFSEHWCDLIFRCISNCMYSIKWEGELFGFFRSTRGVRQGDPLSPTLFIIAMEWFSKSLNQAMHHGAIRPFVSLQRATTISHLLFADDILLFSNGEANSVAALTDLIDKFCSISGEKLNPAKSQIIFSNNIEDTRRLAICNTTGFTNTTLPITYLGAPLYKGRTLVHHFDFLTTRIQKRIFGWAKRLLSMGGRVELVRSVLNAMSVHAMLTLPVPLKVLDNMISIMSSFIWDSGGESRRHWISWNRICLPRTHGGLGIRHPRLMLTPFHSKRVWEFVTSNSLWAKFARSRFRIGRSGSPLWNAISPLISEVKSLGTWRLGVGDTTCGVIGRYYGVDVPSYIRYTQVRNIIDNAGNMSALLEAIPNEERRVFQNVVFDNHPDRFVSRLTKEGLFTIKAYYNRLVDHLNPPPRPWGDHIWRSWIPPKVSCLIWKLYHNVVPTDDAISKLGIQVVSKCSCCSNHTTESALHLFFQSDNAKSAWSRLGALCDRPPPRGKGSLLHYWLKVNKKSSIDCLASGMAACLLWELWKARNDKCHNDKSRPVWNECLTWAPRIAPLIQAPSVQSMQGDILARFLHIRLGTNHPSSPQWLAWHPPTADLVLDADFRVDDSHTSIGGLVRNNMGQIIMAFKDGYNSCDPISALGSALESLMEHCPSLHDSIKLIRSSHYSFWDIRHTESLPASTTYGLRRITLICRDVNFFRVAPGQNLAATALLHTLNNGYYMNIRDLPLPARRAIASDSLLRPSSRNADGPVRTLDDQGIVNQRYVLSPSLDVRNDILH